MLHSLRRLRVRLGRVFIGLFALAWMTVAFQPCASAHDHETAGLPPVHLGMQVELAPMMDHAGMDHAGMDHATMNDAVPPADGACAPGTECPIFKAVADQAAPKAIDPLDLPVQAAPVVIPSWRMPIEVAAREPFFVRHASTPLPPSPILAFRVLLI